MSAMRPLPDEGLDLRKELALLVDQALERTGGDRAAAARLLRTDVLSLERLVKVLAPDGSAPAAAPAALGRLGKGAVKLTREVIRQLDAEGLTAKQIGMRLGVNFYFIEKVLRAEHELASCGPKREPPKDP